MATLRHNHSGGPEHSWGIAKIRGVIESHKLAAGVAASVTLLAAAFGVSRVEALPFTGETRSSAERFEPGTGGQAGAPLSFPAVSPSETISPSASAVPSATESSPSSAPSSAAASSAAPSPTKTKGPAQQLACGVDARDVRRSGDNLIIDVSVSGNTPDPDEVFIVVDNGDSSAETLPARRGLDAPFTVPAEYYGRQYVIYGVNPNDIVPEYRPNRDATSIDATSFLLYGKAMLCGGFDPRDVVRA